jgi:hypothetical protein
MSLIHGYLVGGPPRMIDRKDAGRRVRLDHTSDPLTDLRRGAEGTVRYYRWSHAWDDDDAAQGTLVVDWDCGSTMSLLQGLDTWVLL